VPWTGSTHDCAVSTDWTPVRAYLHEQAGHLDTAAEHYALAVAGANNTAERNHLAKQAARLRSR
jgi:predicted RNA polymerase sigma factor